MKKGSPEGHSVRNEACCRSFGGEWNGGHSHCCFGELKTECNWKGECETHCAHHVDTWKVCETCRKQSCSHESAKYVRTNVTAAVGRLLFWQIKQRVCRIKNVTIENWTGSNERMLTLGLTFIMIHPTKAFETVLHVARSQMQMPTSKVPSYMITWESAWSVGDLIVNRVRSH